MVVTLNTIQWLQRKYIELGGQEGTGMDIDKFAEEYFPKMADGGRIGFDEGSPGKKGGN